MRVERSVTIKKNHALKVRARIPLTDREGNKRVAGETWFVRTPGSYFLGVYEENLGLVSAYILTEKKAIHLKATYDFTDVYGIDRKAG